MNSRTTPSVLLLMLFAFLFSVPAAAQGDCGCAPGVDLDTVSTQRFDMGKMWTFDDPPVEYFKEAYGFEPSAEWLEKVRKSALRFSSWCSASFISADGLIMTNHHCVRTIVNRLAEEDEDILRDGFFAETLEDERRLDAVFVDQLMFIEDVTGRVKAAMAEGADNTERIALRDQALEELIAEYEEAYPDLRFDSVTFYYGGKFSIYGYQRYNDVRLVFIPDLRTAKLGGDFDNFTYPRYGLDCAFFRAYDDEGNPVQTDYYFPWQPEGPQKDEPVFVVGNPGSTNRLYTIAQLEYLRDLYYPMLSSALNSVYDLYLEKVETMPAPDFNVVALLYSIGNGAKVYEGRLDGLNDPVLLARKKDFEKKFRTAVQRDTELNEKYGHLWKEIEATRAKAAQIAPERFAYSNIPRITSFYINMAHDMRLLAEQLQKDESDRHEKYREDALEETINNIYPSSVDLELENKKLLIDIKKWNTLLEIDNPVRADILDGKTGEEALAYLLDKSVIKTEGGLKELAAAGADAILNSGDPFIDFVLLTSAKSDELDELNKELNAQEDINNGLLGSALYEVYGDKIPPDATFTLRIADGVMESYEYNGTVAPLKTTFYGVLDHYYSYDRKFPFNLPEIWENVPEEFDLSTPLNFISTNDIIGGNSGSPVINKKGEVVGLAFDGNMQSLTASFIYTTEQNRTVSVHAGGMLEAIMHLYKAERLGKELLNGKITQ